MKKLLYALIFLLCASSARSAVTYTSGHLTVTVFDTMAHDSTQCGTYIYTHFTITIDTSYIGQTVTIVEPAYGYVVGSFVNTSGVSPWIFTTGAGGVGIGSASFNGSPDFSISGGYAHAWTYARKVIASLDTIMCASYMDSLLVPHPCEYGNASGIIYADNNGNCTYDAGDTGLYVPRLILTEVLMSAGGGLDYSETFSYAGTTDGAYSMLVQKSWMTSYTIGLPPYYSFIFPSSSSCMAGPYTYSTLPQTAVDFPLQCSGNIDLQCDAGLPPRVRLHTPFYLNEFVGNIGCTPTTGQVTLVKDSRTIYDASLSSHPADYVWGDTLVWDFYNLSSLSGGAYWNDFMAGVYLDQFPSVSAGDTLCFRIFTNIPASDINVANNDKTICVPVVYSFDPNVKEVSPAGVGATGDIPGSTSALTYTLHFQNTGTGEAWDITVIDTLDADVDPSSLRILGASHRMTPRWLAPGVVAFDFSGIYLPDSATNEPASHGQVKFSVNLDGGLPAGRQIKNTGYIYFDANPPVITNTVVNTLTSPSGVAPVGAVPDIKIYPNPATDVVTIENLKNGEVSIINIAGVEVMKQVILKDKSTIDISRLPAGMYIIKARNEQNMSTTRFVKY